MYDSQGTKVKFIQGSWYYFGSGYPVDDLDEIEYLYDTYPRRRGPNWSLSPQAYDFMLSRSFA